MGGSPVDEVQVLIVVSRAEVRGVVPDAVKVTHRFKSEAAYVRFCVPAPIPCGSGKTANHRFDRGRNRQLSAALHQIALVLARIDPRAGAFLARKIGEGKPSTRHAGCSTVTSLMSSAGISTPGRKRARSRNRLT
jgi:hypothetical protein